MLQVESESRQRRDPRFVDSPLRSSVGIIDPTNTVAPPFLACSTIDRINDVEPSAPANESPLTPSCKRTTSARLDENTSPKRRMPSKIVSPPFPMFATMIDAACEGYAPCNSPCSTSGYDLPGTRTSLLMGPAHRGGQSAYRGPPRPWYFAREKPLGLFEDAANCREK